MGKTCERVGLEAKGERIEVNLRVQGWAEGGGGRRKRKPDRPAGRVHGGQQPSSCCARHLLPPQTRPPNSLTSVRLILLDVSS